jgi:hypothetical protein
MRFKIFFSLLVCAISLNVFAVTNMAQSKSESELRINNKDAQLECRPPRYCEYVEKK